MLKKQLRLYLIVVLGFLHMGAASAAILSFDPSSQTVGLGASVNVDLRISGLGDDILTGFDLDVSFDDSILDFQSFTFGTGLDVFGFGANLTDVIDFGGVVNVFELSFDLDEDLKDFQPNDFVLGTFNFNTIDYGTSALDIAVLGLAGEYVDDPVLGFPVAKSLDADLESGSISVVPVPAAVWLFGTGLIGLIGFSKRRKAIQQ